MKTVLDIKNVSKVLKPTQDNVVLFDGKEWYVTTKQSLFKEYDEKIARLEQLEEENKIFKKDVATQLIEMSELIKKLYSKKGE